MPARRPNIVMICVDQWRYDTLGIHGHPFVSTPNLDELAATGLDCSRMYSATPTCIPARAELMTGLSQASHKRVGYEEGIEWNYQTTIASELSKRGYYTKCIGKMHVHPARKLLGFHHIELHDGYLHAHRKYQGKLSDQFEMTDDYLDFLKQELGHSYDLNDSGLDCNSWVSRPWPYEERLHPTNWVVSRGIDFLKKRDPTKPFFLKLSFVRPHAPLDPPSYYYNLYERLLDQVPDELLGEWADRTFTHSTTAIFGRIKEQDRRRALVGYYGLLTHLDHQIGRLMMSLIEWDLEEETIVLFVSDHGDQLGDHGLWRKGLPYESSIHIPFIIKDGRHQGEDSDLRLLRDVLPTILKAIDSDVPATVEGNNIFEAGERLYFHGEHALGVASSQFIVSQQYKYIWFSQTGREQFFDLKNDPKEMFDLIHQQAYQADINQHRKWLIDALENRPEGYVQNHQLVVGQKVQTTLP